MQNVQVNLEKRVGVMDKLARLGKKAAVVAAVVLGSAAYGCADTSLCCEKLDCRTGQSGDYSYFCEDGGSSNCITLTEGENKGAQRCCYCDSTYSPHNYDKW